MKEILLETEHRILLRAATPKDALMAHAVLERAGFTPHACAHTEELVNEFERGAGAIILAEEAVSGPSPPALEALTHALGSQPPWSDVPVLVLARQGADSRAITRLMDEFANVAIIERPMRVASLVSAVRTALRARRRQYELRSLLKALHEADLRKTEFLATLAHELRNPLAPLSSTLAVLSRKKPVGTEAERYYQLMGRQVEHMARLVNDLMEISRITRGKIDLHLETVALQTVMSDAIELSRPLIDGAGHALEVRLTDETLTLRGDSVRLAQVFSNLLNNAAKYTRAGGHLKIEARQEGNEAVVDVIDTGAGLAPHMLTLIFDMFVQVRGSLNAAQGGLGIGLTLVKNLVELHGGSIEAHSAGLGLGATFTVRLPLEPGVPLPNPLSNKITARPSTPQEASASAIHGRVLVVDDNCDAANSLRDLLSAMGANAFAVHSGAEALQWAQDHPLEVAIIDIGMPAMDGCDLARHLRAGPAGLAMTLIALTGWGQPADKELSAAAGFDHHLLKPLKVPELVSLLQNVRKSRA